MSVKNMVHLKDWYEHLNHRERTLLWLATAIVIALIFYQFVLRPLDKHTEHLEASLVQQQTLLQWMQTRSTEVKALRARMQHGGEFTRGNLSLTKAVGDTASERKLTLSRVQPKDDNRLQVWLDNANFDQLLYWMMQLQRSHGIVVERVAISQGEQRGYVKVSMELRDTLG